MKTLRYALLAVGLSLGFAAACDVEDIQDLEDLEVDRAAAFSCSAIAPSAEVCIGDDVCMSVAHGKASYRLAPPGGCNASETLIPTPNTDVACGAAEAVVATPTCPGGCAGPVTVPHKTATCCTVEKTCYDPPPPVPPVPPVPPGDADIDADVEGEVDAAEPL
ncbi:MAG: hypothetical protein AB1Z98_16450 [Nannocystaceae bacterium]